MIPARRWFPVALLVALLGGFALVRVQQRLDRSLAAYRTEEQFLYLTSGEWVQRLSLGYDGLLACLYWTRAVQHYGREHMKDEAAEYKLLYPLLDITTTLDPELLLAYRFGAVFLSEDPPGGPGRPQQAIALLRKGIRHNPDYWRFWYDLGFVYYQSLHDYPRAAAAFYEGAKHPNARDYMRVMAAKIAAQGGNRALARSLWAELYNSTDDPMIRKNALSHLVKLDIQALEGLLERYRQQAGRPARSFQELVAAGFLLRSLPRDPLGYPYRLTPDGGVALDPRSPIVIISGPGSEQ